MKPANTPEARRIGDCLSAAARCAARMLPQMVIPDGENAGLFCFKVRRDGFGRLVQEGVSPRYSIIALIGIAAVAGKDGLNQGPWQATAGRLSAMLKQDRLTLGDLGLLLWLDSYGEAEHQAAILDALGRLWPRAYRSVDSMERAWVLTALARHTGSTGFREELMNSVLESILADYREDSGLFCLNNSARSGFWSRKRFGRVLGSFASQVYPLVALSAYAEAGGSAPVTPVIRAAAATTCSLQGPRGEWWWLFDTRSGSVYLDYPVYSVHQDAMAPMGLLAASKALNTDRFLPSVALGLEHLFTYEEPRSGLGFVEEPFIWRAAIKDIDGEDPADMPFGIGAEDFRYVHSAGRPAWLGAANPVQGRHVRMLREARPYCPGWILYAYAQARELLGVCGKLDLTTGMLEPA